MLCVWRVLDCVELYVALPEMPPPPITWPLLSFEVLSLKSDEGSPDTVNT